MSEETEKSGEQGPFTKPGFIASAVVLFVVVILGIYLIWSPGGDTDEATSEEQEVPTASDEPTANESEGSNAEADSDSICGLSGGAEDADSLTRAPESDSWEYEGTVSYPVSEEYGPAETDESGFRYCFQRSPEGALFFAANAVQQGDETSSASEWIDYATSEGEYRDEFVQDVGTGAEEDVRIDIVGFRVVSFSPDSAVVHLAVDGHGQGETVNISAEYYLVWEDGDWKFDADQEEPLSMVTVGGHGGQVTRWVEGD